MPTRVFNITDGSTAALRNRHMENQHIRLGEVVIPPGEFADIRGTAKELSDAHVFVKMGALTIGELPEMYATKRNLKADGTPLNPPAPPPPAPAAELISEPAPELEVKGKKR